MKNLSSIIFALSLLGGAFLAGEGHLDKNIYMELSGYATVFADVAASIIIGSRNKYNSNDDSDDNYRH